MPETYLEICQQVIEDAGISGTMATVASQTGEFKRVTNWVRRAASALEQRYFNWNFLSNSVSINTVASQQDYTSILYLHVDSVGDVVVGTTITGDLSAATATITSVDTAGFFVTSVVGAFEVGEELTTSATATPGIEKISRVNHWDAQTFKITADEQVLDFEDWNIRKLNATLPSDGDPYSFTILPSKAIRLYDTPDSVVTIGCDFWQASDPLVNDTDTPSIPIQFRDIIAYKALEYYALYESAEETLAYAKEGFTPLWEQLKASELPGYQASSAVSTGVNIQVQVPYDVGY